MAPSRPGPLYAVIDVQARRPAKGPFDEEEPEGEDGGAGHFAACVREIKRVNPKTAVEALTPDFQGVLEDVETVVDSGLDVFAQNVETVRRLTHPVRDPRASYEQTLAVLAHAKRHRPGVLTKTSLMLGLGESDAEILATMDDLRAAGVDILTLGQYLRPSAAHLPVARFYTPDEFAQTLQFIAEGQIDVAPMITGRVGVEGVPGAFETLAKPDVHAKILVEPWRA